MGKIIGSINSSLCQSRIIFEECSDPCMDMRIILEVPTIIRTEEGET